MGLDTWGHPVMSSKADTPGRADEVPLSARDFRQIYGDHRRAVYARARRSAGPEGHELAEDVTQEVFLRFWRHPERFDASRGSLRTYLLTVGHSVAVDMIRSSAARRTREDNDEWRRPALPTDIDGQLLQADQRAIVLAALDRLDSGLRDAILTSYFGGRTYREAAIALGLPEGTVKSRIRHGLHLLRASLAASAASDGVGLQRDNLTASATTAGHR